MLANELHLTQRSYYEASATRPPANAALAENITVDVCVIGAGLAGLSSALELAQAGMKVAVLEAKQIGWGASGRNGGQALIDIASGVDVVKNQLGLAAAKTVWGASIEAVQLVKDRISQFKIDTDWQSGYLGLGIKPRKVNELRTWFDEAQATYDYPHMQWLNQADLPQHIHSPRFQGGVYDSFAGHLHPLKYTLGIAAAAKTAGVAIYENTPALKYRKTAHQKLTIETARGNITADFMIVAGNVYHGEFAPQLGAKIMPVGTYIIATEPLGATAQQSCLPTNAAVCDNNFILDYFRFTADTRLLFGGRVSYTTLTPFNLEASMKARMLAAFPQLGDAKIDYAWGGFVDITMNRAPNISQLSPNVYYAQGFSGHGVALTGLAGKIMAQSIQKQASSFEVFSKLKHANFPGGKWLRMPSLVAAMQWYKLRDLL